MSVVASIYSPSPVDAALVGGVLVAGSSVPAGFPSPAQDYFDSTLDLNRHLIRDTVSTFIVRVSGNSMTGAGISDGDELIVDRAKTPVDGSIVLAVIDGEITVKRLHITDTGVLLVAENPAYEPIHVNESDLSIWGVATRCLHHL